MNRSAQIKPPLRLTFIAGQLGLGGAEKQLYLLVRGLRRAGWQISVITLHSFQGDYWEGPLRELDVSVHGIGVDLPRLQRLLAIRSFLCRQQAQIVHSWMMHANFYAAAAGRLSATPVRFGSERCNHHSSRERLGHALYNMSLWGLDNLVANSEPAAAFLRRYRPHLTISVVPNGVEIPAPLPNAEQKKRLRQVLGISPTACVIGAVGSMTPRKNFAMLINAVSLLSGQATEIVLVLIGDGPLRADLERQALSSLPKGRILFTGALPNVGSWLPAFDLLCMPSFDQEGTPNVLMEASAVGLPVVATAIGGVPAIVDDGVTGFLAPSDDVHTLVERLRKLLVDSDLRRRLGQAGREKMRGEFGVDAMVARMRRVYEETLAVKGLA